MRIVIDGSPTEIYWKGSGVYVRALWQALHQIELPPDFELIMLHPSWQRIAGDRGIAMGRHYRTRRPILNTNRLHAKMLYWENVILPISAAKLSPDLLHATSNAPLISPCPLIVTVHDLAPLVLPEFKSASSSRGYRLRSVLWQLAIRHATRVITDSHYSKKDIIRVLGVPEERIDVIYLAADKLYRPIAELEAASLKARFELPDSYIFYVGGFERYKNVTTLLQAYATLTAQVADAPILAIAGRVPTAAESQLDPTMFPALLDEAEHLGLGNKVRWLGRVSNEDKAALYGASTITVFPSTHEGFGLVPIEALASGAPLICSNRTSLPEVVGDAGILLDPTNVGELSAAMIALLDDPVRQAELRAAGPRQAARFSWQRTAQQTLSAYMAAVQHRTGNQLASS